jgi:hypothetical protein
MDARRIIYVRPVPPITSRVHSYGPVQDADAHIIANWRRRSKIDPSVRMSATEFYATMRAKGSK